MNSSKIKIAVLGAGPAGLALALNILRSHSGVDVFVIEQRPYVGGLASSFEKEGLIFDYGSHRLHPSTNTLILNDLKIMLGTNLLNRPRNGRIKLLGKFVKFPLNPLNLTVNLPPSFVSGVLYDSVVKQILKKKQAYDSFADFLLDGLGPTVCHNFYFPYAKKLWGLDANEISVDQAKRRVSANNFSKIAKGLLSKLPGIRSKSTGRFYYPLKGFGEISSAFVKEIKKLNGKILLSATVKKINIHENCPRSVVFTRDNMSEYASHHGTDELEVDFVFSTIPITVLIKCINPPAPENILKVLEEIKYRAMILYYLLLEVDQFTPYDAHYFPGSAEIFSRMSEPKNYSNSAEPKGLTGLCLEIPCSTEDKIWRTSDSEIGETVIQQLQNSDLRINANIRDKFSRRLEYVYPVYNIGYESYFKVALSHLLEVDRLISLGRQGLFMHNNTHHSLEMAYRASECLKPDLSWDSELWQFYCDKFVNYVVED